ncbi:MAG: DUF3536 domain-containing protein [Armatimonadota bacterium]|nr:DUF3536 domain-containing protein [Armatimonadota bacterium]MDR7451105.1 DUF3536 domain-containing protein [Armatimonadota bacterium]MDR7467290.1 DUF3536 domain-containing protein [Armatimonadota bacterium]MDR7494551.1 DUF3536 domain-containing protein [Armatimonadota bacterium]MDR7499872.1 DUF3536 domain-containing protein [Armatimonadota bacterium]
MRHLCVHGHFYQPSRENPWTDTVELAEAAAPYHDWNERITAECYARNAASRLLDDAGRITRIVNNFAGISYDVGPTLLRWLARHAPAVYEQILEADRISRREQYGHGNAVAQVYTHLIMPLATGRDRVTQVRWGIRDFERRFRRRPEGMWLPETAVDIATLEILAAHGVAFTFLAPHQARRIRRAEGAWTEVTAETLDVTVPYRCRLPSGRSVAIFFYHAPVSHAVAFEGLLHDGAAFADRLVAAAPDDQQARLVVAAADGETYGHHHRFGDMALAYALHRIATAGAMRIVNAAAFLAAHPPACDVEIVENTSWSCAHGVERWRSDCGCNTGRGWHQRWRGPLREGIAWLTEQLEAAYARHGEEIFRDVWAARDEAVDLIDAGPGAVEAFLARHARDASPGRRARALRLLAMQRHGALMQSSDGWFFDDISGPETVQILSHAARAMEIARAFGLELEDGFLDHLRRAPGNLAAFPDGAAVYERLVRPRVVGPREATACFAMTALVGAPSVRLAGTTTVTELDRADVSAASHRLLVGRVRVRAAEVEEDRETVYALVHFGSHEVHCAVAPDWDEARYRAVRDRLVERSGKDVVSEVVRAVDQAFGPHYFSLRDLPLEDRRAVLQRLTERTLQDLEDVYRRLYRDNRPLMVYLRDAGVDVPAPLVTAAVVALTRDLEEELSRDAAVPLRPRVFELLAELRSWGREIRADRFEPLLRRRLEQALAGAGHVADRVARALEVLDFAEAAGLTLNLWEAQNAFSRLARAAGDGALVRLGERLHFAMEKLG